MIQAVNEYTLGWIGYFRLADTPSVFRELDEWLRRRLRQLVWKRWKRAAHPATRTWWRWVCRRDGPRSWRAVGRARGDWRHRRLCNKALSNAYWQRQGLRSITERYHQLRTT